MFLVLIILFIWAGLVCAWWSFLEFIAIVNPNPESADAGWHMVMWFIYADIAFLCFVGLAATIRSYQSLQRKQQVEEERKRLNVSE